MMLGLCLPSACTVKILSKVSDKLNPLFFKAVQMLGIDYLNKNNFSAVAYF